MEVVLALPRGFCAGVVRAVDIVEMCIKKFGAPIYVKHEIVHNPYVVASLESKGAVTVEDVGEIPEESVVVFLRPRLSSRGLREGVRTESQGHRRHLPPGYEGAQRSKEVPQGGP